MAKLLKLCVDNYLSLVDFQLDFGDLSVLIGPNGAGKTALFSALRRMRDFAVSGESVDLIFPFMTRNRASQSLESHFKISAEIDGDLYRYSIHIHHPSGTSVSRVLKEELTIDDKRLVCAQDKFVELYLDDFTLEARFESDMMRSCLLFVPATTEKTKIRKFKEFLSNIIFVAPDPFRMASVSDMEAKFIDVNLGNFASWFLLKSRSMDFLLNMRDKYSELVDGFVSTSFEDIGGGRRVLMVAMANGEGGQTKFLFEELSEGQKISLALMAIFDHAEHNQSLLCLDEPDNYLSPNANNFLLKFLEENVFLEGKFQAIIASHHPQFIEDLLLDKSVYLSRPNNGRTVAKDISTFTHEDISMIMRMGLMHELAD